MIRVRRRLMLMQVFLINMYATTWGRTHCFFALSVYIDMIIV